MPLFLTPAHPMAFPSTYTADRVVLVGTGPVDHQGNSFALRSASGMASFLLPISPSPRGASAGTPPITVLPNARRAVNIRELGSTLLLRRLLAHKSPWDKEVHLAFVTPPLPPSRTFPSRLPLLHSTQMARNAAIAPKRLLLLFIASLTIVWICMRSSWTTFWGEGASFRFVKIDGLLNYSHSRPLLVVVDVDAPVRRVCQRYRDSQFA